MEQSTKPKHELAIVYLKSTDRNSMYGTRETDRALIRKWLRENSHVDNYDLMITTILDASRPYREVMDELLESIKDHKYFIFITQVGCHATKYFYEQLLATAEKTSCVTLLTVVDSVNIRSAAFQELPPITIKLDSIRRCMTANQLDDVMDGAARIVTRPNGMIELSYVSAINVEIERRPETLDEKFNTIMQGGLSNLVPYWDVTPVYIDPIPVKPNPEVDQSLESASETAN